MVFSLLNPEKTRGTVLFVYKRQTFFVTFNGDDQTINYPKFFRGRQILGGIKSEGEFPENIFRRVTSLLNFVTTRVSSGVPCSIFNFLY